MQQLDLNKLQEFAAAGFVKKELVVADNFKLLLICFEPGQEVEPCVMSRNTVFYIVEGEGVVIEEGEKAKVSKGSMVLIEPELERQIKAKTKMTVFAIQYS
jgi:quercetin dioxygenase-like cupin family protein